MGPLEVALILFGVFGALIILRVPVAFALGLACVPVFFIDDRLTPFLLLNEMLKSYNSFLLLAIPFFMLAANLMNSAGITEKLINLSRALVGHLPGGLGHVSVLVSMLFAGISGSSTAEAAGVGGVLIPAMKKQGYDTPFTVSLVACAAVMGVIIPPSILMVVWGGVISVSIGGLFIAGVVPGVLMGLSLMAAVYLYAKRRNYPVYPRTTWREFLKVCVAAVLPILTPGIIVGGIVGGLFTPTEASVVAVLYAMLLGVVIYRTLDLDAAAPHAVRLGALRRHRALLHRHGVGVRLDPRLFPHSRSSSSTQSRRGAAASPASASSPRPRSCSSAASSTRFPAIIIVGTILAPLAAKVGMHPIHFAIIGVISIAYGLVTPPYGLCLMIACSIGGIKIKEAVRDTAILFIPMLLVLADRHPVPGPDPVAAAPPHAGFREMTRCE